MKNFSERTGITKPKEETQIESMSNELRNSLWNALHKFYWTIGGYGAINFYRMVPEMCKFADTLWDSYFRYPIDTVPDDWGKTNGIIRDYFFKAKWYEVYNFVEFIATNYPNEYKNANFIKECNRILESELSAYRFIGKQIAAITSNVELSEIEEAMTSPLKSVNVHLENSLKLMSNRVSPDYRNSIKESISAVEAICKIIANDEKTTLGRALSIIERESKITLHTSLKEAFSNLYAYTNDADGIRHSLKEDKIKADFEEAKFMLVSCSAFVNYLKVKATKNGIALKK